MNNDIMRVEPHITNYTVYITDNYTGNSILEKNVTEARFTFIIPDGVICPTYQVSCWNAGGQGNTSELMQGCVPRSK